MKCSYHVPVLSIATTLKLAAQATSVQTSVSKRTQGTQETGNQADQAQPLRCYEMMFFKSSQNRSVKCSHHVPVLSIATALKLAAQATSVQTSASKQTQGKQEIKQSRLSPLDVMK